MQNSALMHQPLINADASHWSADFVCMSLLCRSRDLWTFYRVRPKMRRKEKQCNFSANIIQNFRRLFLKIMCI